MKTCSQGRRCIDTIKRAVFIAKDADSYVGDCSSSIGCEWSLEMSWIIEGQLNPERTCANLNTTRLDHPSLVAHTNLHNSHNFGDGSKIDLNNVSLSPPRTQRGKVLRNSLSRKQDDNESLKDRTLHICAKIFDMPIWLLSADMIWADIWLQNNILIRMFGISPIYYQLRGKSYLKWIWNYDETVAYKADHKQYITNVWNG